jgi:hypothetical protein
MDQTTPNWAPLEVVIPADGLGEWMWMGRVAHGDVVIEQYKHVDTRRYLCLDQTNRAWRVSYAVPTDPKAPTPEPTIAQTAVAEAVARALG